MASEASCPPASSPVSWGLPEGGSQVVCVLPSCAAVAVTVPEPGRCAATVRGKGGPRGLQPSLGPSLRLCSCTVTPPASLWGRTRAGWGEAPSPGVASALVTPLPQHGRLLVCRAHRVYFTEAAPRLPAAPGGAFLQGAFSDLDREHLLGYPEGNPPQPGASSAWSRGLVRTLVCTRRPEGPQLTVGASY